MSSGSIGTPSSLVRVRESPLTKKGTLSKKVSFQTIVKKLHPEAGENIVKGKKHWSRYKSRVKCCTICGRWFPLGAYIQHAKGIREVNGQKTCYGTRGFSSWYTDKKKKENARLAVLRRHERIRMMEEEERKLED